MSAQIVVPFNFQPFSVTNHVGPYTIPAGFYGVVKTQCGNLTINSQVMGYTVFVSSDLAAGNSDLGSGQAWYSYSISYTGNAGTKSVSVSTISSDASIQSVLYSASLNSTTATTTGSFWGAGCRVSRAITGGNITAGGCTLTSMPDSEYWVKAGDIIGGYSFSVTLYPQIT